MKKFTSNFLTALAVCASLGATATTRTVNNSTSLPVNPGQYTTIAAALAASSNGDTILVAGSYTNYETATLNINKSITLLGPGYNPSVAVPKPAKIAQTVNISSIAASGTTIMGIEFDRPFNTLAGVYLNNITLRRNYFTSSVDFEDSCSNVLMAENVCGGQGFNGVAPVYFSTTKTGFYNLKIENNVFFGLASSPAFLTTPSGSTNVLEVIIDHNLFLRGFNGATAAQMKPIVANRALLTRNAVISNNIFYGCFPIDTTTANITNPSGTSVNNVFNNNITYASITLPALPYGSNIGSGNVDNTNPLLTTIFSSTLYPSLDFNLDNLRLQSTSTASNAGSDVTDIGPTGGTYPIYNASNIYLTGEPPIPEVKSINFTSSTSVAPGTNVTVTVTANKIN